MGALAPNPQNPSNPRVWSQNRDYALFAAFSHDSAGFTPYLGYSVQQERNKCLPVSRAKGTFLRGIEAILTISTAVEEERNDQVPTRWLVAYPPVT